MGVPAQRVRGASQRRKSGDWPSWVGRSTKCQWFGRTQ